MTTGSHRYPGRIGRVLGRALVAGSLSMVLPGLGQLFVGRRRRGLVFLGSFAALALGAAVVAAGGTLQALTLLVRPDAITALLVGNVAFAAFRLTAAIDAFLLVARGQLDTLGRRAAAGTAIVALGTLTVAPHAVTANYGWRAHQMLTTVFTDEPPTEPAPVADDVVPGPSPEARTEPADPHGVDAGTNVEVEIHYEFPWQERDRLTIALLGSDAGPGRTGARADALLVVTLELSTGTAAAVSVPRNLQDYPVPAALRQIFAICPNNRGYEQISGLYACLTDPQYAGRSVVSHYPETRDAAARAMADTLEALLEQPVDYYAVVDLGGFIDVVDALGGVEVHVTRPIKVRLSPARPGDGWRTYTLPVGGHHLDGAHALAYVRSRTGSTDYDRMHRQRCLIGSMVDQTAPSELVRALPELVDVVIERVRTDVPVDALPPLIEVLGHVDLEEIGTLGLNPPQFQAADSSPRLGAIREAVQALFDDPHDAADDYEAVETAQQACR